MPKAKQEKITYEDGITEDIRENIPTPIPEIDYEKLVTEAEERDKEIYQPQKEKQVKEFIDNFDEVIDSEKQFLDLFNPDRYKIEVIYGTQGQSKLFKLEVIPVKDQDLSYIDMDLNIYDDLNNKERQVIDKNFTGEKLTKKEHKMLDEIEAKEKAKQTQKVNEMLCMLLANHITWPNHEKNTLKQRVAFWKQAPFDFRTYLGEKVLAILGLDNRNSITFFRSDNK